MRVFVAGASGDIGQRLVPQLIAAGHEVVGTHHRPETASRLRVLGAKPVALDLLDAPRVRRAVLDAKLDAVIHQATALGNVRFSRNAAKMARPTNLLRSQGTDVLLAAAKETGVDRFVAQSFAMFRHAREGGLITEDEPLDPSPPAGAREGFEALLHLEESVTHSGGIALRYGSFYGGPNDGFRKMVLKRQMPIIGNGTGIFSFIHLDDAAAATVLALERGQAGIYNVVDDEPAPMREWLPAMAAALRAKPPLRVPYWLLRLLGGPMVGVMKKEARGQSNAKAKRELGWRLKYPSWRQGFPAAYSGMRVPG
jgi:nucleoside-diphosphate-sugar epimerase